jgi:hypothetical protein
VLNTDEAQEFDSLQLLNDMLETPDDFSRHLQRFTTSVASTVLYGWRTTNSGERVKDLMDVSHMIFFI